MSLGGQKSDDMHHLTSGPMGGQQSGLTSAYAGLMDDTDDYMDYMGGASPLGLSSESSNQDRSCTSTPVGNEGSPAGTSVTGKMRWLPIGGLDGLCERCLLIGCWLSSLSCWVIVVVDINTINTWRKVFLS